MLVPCSGSKLSFIKIVTTIRLVVLSMKDTNKYQKLQKSQFKKFIKPLLKDPF